MQIATLTASDLDLVDRAHAEFDVTTQHDWHGVACALRLASGKTYSGLVLEAQIPSLSICAEPIVIGKALGDLKTDPVQAIVAVRARANHLGKVIPPCGRCREFITDYCPEATVILFDPTQEKLIKVAATHLLPFKEFRQQS